MDKNNGILCVEPERSEFAGFRLLERVDPQTVTPEHFAQLWERVQSSEKSLDDFARGNIEWFLGLLLNPANEFYQVEDTVLVILINITERGACDIHYFTWNKEWGLAGFRHIAKEVLDYVFFARKVHHVVGYIPECNQQAVRFAIGAGLKFEGEIRENFLYQGEYYATHIYGILDREYADVRRRFK